MTSTEGYPAVNGADTDLSLSFMSLVIGLVLATLSYVTTRPGPRRAYMGHNATIADEPSA